MANKEYVNKASLDLIEKGVPANLQNLEMDEVTRGDTILALLFVSLVLPFSVILKMRPFLGTSHSSKQEVSTKYVRKASLDLLDRIRPDNPADTQVPQQDKVGRRCITWFVFSDSRHSVKFFVVFFRVSPLSQRERKALNITLRSPALTS